MNAMTRTLSPLRHRIIRLSVGLGLAASLAGGFALPAFAADSLTQGVTAGSRTASVADLGLSGKTSSHVDQASTGNMTLTADDSTGSGAGWNVTIVSSDFDYAGAFGGADIGAVGFALTSAALPVATAGQAVDVAPGNGPEASVTSGTLDTARKVISAGATFGSGTYTQLLVVNLTIPAESRVGTYTGTLTTSMVASP